MTNSGDIPVEYDLEYRSIVDDAWYSVLVLLKDDTLTVKIWQFDDAYNETFNAADFKTPQAVDEFVQRFRPVSGQVQDSECSRITKGMMVCATVTSKNKDDIRYYDAIVEDVYKKEHMLKKEERCKCTFALCWKNGPREGTITCSKIKGICQIQSCAQIDHRVASFSKIAKEKIRSIPLKSNSAYKENLCKIKSESTLSQLEFKKMRNARELISPILKSEDIGMVCESYLQIDYDRDMGAGCLDIEEKGSQYFTIIENLEKDLSPSSIIEFIHKQTSVKAQAYVFPSLCLESYTRGAIVSDCKEELEKIFKFLSSPDHIIISSRGRPWVVSEKILRRGTVLTTFVSFTPKSQDKLQCENIDNVLKVVHKGEEEYKMAKEIKDLIMDFLDHQHRLHRSLEERMIVHFG